LLSVRLLQRRYRAYGAERLRGGAARRRYHGGARWHGLRWPGLRTPGAMLAKERIDQVDREREDNGGVLLDSDLGQRLQIAELNRHRVPVDDLGRLGELLTGLELALGVNDLRSLFALGLGLPRHRALHRRRQLDVLHF